MKAPCMPLRWFDNWTKEFYVHMKDVTAIKTQQELWKICCQCDEFLSCQKYLLLNTLLANNETKTRQGT
jgi:hypothetical protein